MSIVPVSTAVPATVSTENAVRTFAAGILRRKRSVSSVPLSTDQQVRYRIAIVVVLMPPAVPPGLPPINIRIHESSCDCGRKRSCGIVKNPAVRVVTDWNIAASHFPPTGIPPKLLGFEYSMQKIPTVPIATSETVITSASFVMTVSLVAIGTVGIFCMEYSNPRTLGGMPVRKKSLARKCPVGDDADRGFFTIPQGSPPAAVTAALVYSDVYRR